MFRHAGWCGQQEPMLPGGRKTQRSEMGRNGDEDDREDTAGQSGCEAFKNCEEKGEGQVRKLNGQFFLHF